MASPDTSEIRPSFRKQLQKKWDQGKFLCVGLDPDGSKIPQHLKNEMGEEEYAAISIFAETIINYTGDLVCAYKPNIAFYENSRNNELALDSIVSHIHKNFPDVPVIGDVKRADIGNTNRGYARMAYERYAFDAITTNPYFGGDTFPPFQTYENRGLIVLCRTTNPGSKELQDMPIRLDYAKETGLLSSDELRTIRDKIPGLFFMKVYEMVAFLAARRWNTNGQLALVVGATHPEAFVPVRQLAGDLPFLIPGIGTQGGDLEKTLKYAPDSRGQGMIINSGSAIIYASAGEDFAEAARAATIKLDRQIREGLGIA